MNLMLGIKFLLNAEKVLKQCNIPLEYFFNLIY